MKKVIRIMVIVLLALSFLGTFVFLYQKSQPKETTYEILPTKIADSCKSCFRSISAKGNHAPPSDNAEAVRLAELGL